MIGILFFIKGLQDEIVIEGCGPGWIARIISDLLNNVNLPVKMAAHFVQNTGFFRVCSLKIYCPQIVDQILAWGFSDQENLMSSLLLIEKTHDHLVSPIPFQAIWKKIISSQGLIMDKG